jgi:AraC family transcriptional regulator
MWTAQKNDTEYLSASPAGSERVVNSTTSVAAAIARLMAHIGTFVGDSDLARDYIFQASALLRAGRVDQGGANRELTNVPRGGLAPWQTKRILSHIDSHISDTFSIPELAGLVKLSPSHFHRAFKSSLGVAPFAYIAARRVERACQLMITSNEPLSQIAIDCGMSDQSHLCRVFRRVMAQSPNAWRRKHFVHMPAAGDGMEYLNPMNADGATRNARRSGPIPQEA